MKKTLVLIFILFIFKAAGSSVNAQHRIAVLPFQNMDGKMKYNIWCYNLQDSLEKKLVGEDPKELNYVVIPSDSIEIHLAEMNLDPSSPEYESDMWKVVEELEVNRVVSGNFYIQSNRLIINAFVYNTKMKIPHPQHQAKNIFKKESDVYEAIPIIYKRLKPAILGN